MLLVRNYWFYRRLKNYKPSQQVVIYSEKMTFQEFEKRKDELKDRFISINPNNSIYYNNGLLEVKNLRKNIFMPYD